MAPPATAQERFPDGRVVQGRLSFDAEATLGDFTGITDSVAGYMTGGALTEVRGWVEAPVRTLKTGNNRRDRDLVKTMEADIYPNIRFVLEGVSPRSPPGDSMEVQLSGRFYIHGTSRPDSFPGTVRRVARGVRLTASFPMNLKDYEIGGLTRFLVLRMDPDIVVHVDVTFAPAGER